MTIIMHTLVDENGKTYQVSEGVLQQILRAGGIDDVLPDGGVVKVPVMMMDGRPFRQATSAHGSRDADPRFGPVTDAQQQEINRAYFDYCDYLQNAWKHDRDPVPQRRQQQPQLVAPQRHEQQPRRSSTPVMDEREAAYREYCERISNAWRAAK